MRLAHLLCLIRHEPMRRQIDWDGRRYVGTCRRCRTPIQRVASKVWQPRETAQG